MISYEEARSILARVAAGRSIVPEIVPLTQAQGLILSEEILSPEAVPAFDNSAMDGFVLPHEATLPASAEKPVYFDVMGIVAAGDVSAGYAGLERPVAVEIMTGAPIPDGNFTAVVKIEDVELVRDLHGNVVRIGVRNPAKPEEYFRKRGEDFEVGQKIAEAGDEVTPEMILALSSLGVAQVKARRKPRIALISTGRELVDHTTARLSPGMIRNSTAPYLMSAIPLCGADARFYGTVGDDPKAFLKLFEEACADSPDLIVTTGAVSMGKYDFVRPTLEEAGAKVHFHKVAIRPGKPLLFAELPKGPVIFGVPGNPVSTSVGLRFFIEPYLRGLRDLAAEKPVMARLKSVTRKPHGLKCFFKARLDVRSQGAEVEILQGQASFMVSSLLKANAWAVLSENGEEARESEALEVYPLFPASYSWGSGT